MRHDNSVAKFALIIERAKNLLYLYDYINETSRSLVDASDLLRSAVVLAASGLDLLIHDLLKDEIVYRCNAQISMIGVSIPIALIHSSTVTRDADISSAIHEQNAHRSFLDPAKLSQLLSTFCKNPWGRIADVVGEDEGNLKSQMREFYRWRNRIAHEGDIDPSYASTSLWPARRSDVQDALKFIHKIGVSLPNIL